MSNKNQTRDRRGRFCKAGNENDGAKANSNSKNSKNTSKQSKKNVQSNKKSSKTSRNDQNGSQSNLDNQGSLGQPGASSKNNVVNENVSQNNSRKKSSHKKSKSKSVSGSENVRNAEISSNPHRNSLSQNNHVGGGLGQASNSQLLRNVSSNNDNHTRSNVNVQNGRQNSLSPQEGRVMFDANQFSSNENNIFLNATSNNTPISLNKLGLEWIPDNEERYDRLASRITEQDSEIARLIQRNLPERAANQMIAELEVRNGVLKRQNDSGFKNLLKQAKKLSKKGK